MRFLIVYWVMLAPLFTAGQAISFYALGGGITSCTSVPAVRALYYDSVDNKLYAGGFLIWADNKVANSIAVWNGSVWDTLAGGLTQYPHVWNGSYFNPEWVHKIVRFQNKIHVSGGFQWVNGKAQGGYAIYNGSTWVYPIAEMPNAMIKDFVVHNGLLYACGLFTKFGNTTCNYVAKYDGSSWIPVGDFNEYTKGGTPAQINTIEFYQDELYMGGLFADSTNTTRNIAKFDGTKWVNVSMGIQQGGTNAVWDLASFKGELYIGGRFLASNDIPENSLIKWDGNNFKSVGHQLSSGTTVWQLKSNRKHLFVQGVLQDIGESGIYNVLYLDSGSACQISKMKQISTQCQISCIETVGDSLIVGGDFNSIDLTSANSVAVVKNYDNASLCQFVDLKEHLYSTKIRIYPNPVGEILVIEFETQLDEKIDLSILNSLGQEVIFQKNLRGFKTDINLSGLASGVYFLKLSDGLGQRVVKVLKN